MKQLLCKSLFIFFFVALFRSNYAANEPCTAMDPGSTPAAPPRLFIDVHEANKQDLLSGGDKYLSEIRLHGVYGSNAANGIQLTFANKYRTIDPVENFVFESEPNSPYRNMIRLTKPIDRDGATYSPFDDTIIDNFRLKCVPYKNQTLEYWYEVSLLIHDINDNAPLLNEDNVYTAVVNELIPVGSALPITISATDKDSGSNRELTYEISPSAVGSKAAEYLMIHNETGKVYIKKTLDYETLNAANRIFHLPIAIHDNGKLLQLTSTATLTITVTDGDDLGPQFSHPACQRAFGGKCFTPTYNADAETVSKNVPILFKSSGGGPQMQIRAKDGDTLGAKVNIKISAVIPGQYKSSFELKVTPPETGGDGYYTASLELTKSVDKSALVGTVVYVTATEDTPRKLFSVARILFKGKSSGENLPAKGSDPDKKKVEEEGKYNRETVALIVVVAILAVITVIAVGALISLHFRRKNDKETFGNINHGMSHL